MVPPLSKSLYLWRHRGSGRLYTLDGVNVSSPTEKSCIPRQPRNMYSSLLVTRLTSRVVSQSATHLVTRLLSL